MYDIQAVMCCSFCMQLLLVTGPGCSSQEMHGPAAQAVQMMPCMYAENAGQQVACNAETG